MIEIQEYLKITVVSEMQLYFRMGKVEDECGSSCVVSSVGFY